MDTGRFAGRLAVEGLVVMASILLAFGLDAWWDARELDRDVAQELQSVRRELEENRRLMLTEIRSLERIIAGSGATVAAMEAGSGGNRVMIADTLAFLVGFWGPTLDASFGAVDALIASGRLSRIGDAELRMGLAGLKDRFEDPVEDELLAQQIQVEQLFPRLSAVDLGAASRIDAAFFAVARPIDSPIPSSGMVEFPNDLATRNAIRHRAAWLSSALGEMRPLLVDIDALISLMQR